MRKLIDEIINHQYSSKIMVTFEKVQAHSGEFGNCQADKHAKMDCAELSQLPATMNSNKYKPTFNALSQTCDHNLSFRTSVINIDVKPVNLPVNTNL